MFRVGGATAQLRHAFLDTISDAATKAAQTGRAVQATSSNGASTTFQFFAGWKPDDALELIDAAREWAGAADVTTALALVEPDIREYGFIQPEVIT